MEVKHVMNKKSHVQKIVLVAMIMILVAGCRRNTVDNTRYAGEHPELYSIAINSLVATRGYTQSEIKMQASIKLIEEDNYGRKLFIYSEGRGYHLVISQKSDEKYVYFYPDYNFIITISEDAGDIGLRFTDEKIFPPEEIEELKEYNDWNKEIDIEKCIKVEIVHQKDDGPMEYKVLKPIYEELLGDDVSGHIKHRIFLFTTDDYGRSIYEFYGKGSYCIMVLFQPDGTYNESDGVMKLMHEELQYQDKLKEFKELNNWNKPIQEN